MGSVWKSRFIAPPREENGERPPLIGAHVSDRDQEREAVPPIPAVFCCLSYKHGISKY